MSAALQAEPGQPQLPPRNKGHARTLLRRLLANPRLADRYEDPKIVPRAARPVLDAAVELVALAGDGICYRPDPAVDGERSLAERVARRMRAIGDEAGIEHDLGLLARTGFIVLADGGELRLGVTFSRGTRRTSPSPRGTSVRKVGSNRQNAAGSIGRPRKDEPEGEYRGRLAVSKREHKRKSVPGGSDAGAENQTINQTETNLVFPENQIENQTGEFGFPVGFSGPPASHASGEYSSVVVAVEEVNNINPLTATTASPDPRAGASAGNPAGSQKNQPETNLVFSKNQMENQTGAPGASAAGPGAAGGRGSGVSPEAVELAAEAVASLALVNHHKNCAPAVMQGYLAEGYSPAQIRQAVAARVGKGLATTSLQVLDKALKGAFPTVGTTAGPAPALAGPAPPPATENAAQRFARQQQELQDEMGQLLQAGNQPEVERKLSFVRQRRQEHVAPLVAAFPCLEALLPGGRLGG